jgi:hypothetical protein
MVWNGKIAQKNMHDLGVPPFEETAIFLGEK